MILPLVFLLIVTERVRALSDSTTSIPERVRTLSDPTTSNPERVRALSDSTTSIPIAGDVA